MTIQGTVFKITDLEAFFDSYFSQPNAPDPETFAPLPNARVQLRTGLPLVPLSVEAVTGGDGDFSLNPPANVGPATARLLVHRRVPVVQADAAALPGPIKVPTVEQLAYRSARVRLDRLDDEPLAIYTAAPEFQAEITQAEVDAQLAPVAASLQADELTAQIVDGGLQVHAERGPARVDLRVRVRADASAELDEFVEGVVEDLEVHVPFPASLCADEQEIAAQVRAGVRDAFAEVNSTLKAEAVAAIAASSGFSKALVTLVFDQVISLSIRRLRFPVAGGERVIEATPAVAVPRGALTPAPLLPAAGDAAAATAAR